jgi:drug/metabolite transporter (DMT)-like permease
LNHPSEHHPIRGYFYIAAAGLCWAASAGMGKAVFTGRHLPGGPLPPLDPQILSQMRVTISLLALAPVLFALRGTRAFAMALPDVGRCLLLGILGLAGSNFFYYYAIQKSSITTAIIVQYTGPVWVLLYMVSRGYQRPTRVRVSAVVAAVIGSMIAIGIFRTEMKLAWLGIGASLLAAFSFSFYNVFGRDLVRRHERWKVIVFALLGAALFWMVIHSPRQIVAAHYSRGQWIFMLVFAFLSMLIPFSFYFSGLRYLDPTRAIVTSCLEPVFTILIAAILLGEPFGAVQTFGMVIVLAATIVIQLPESRVPEPLPSGATLTEHLE